MTRDFKAWTRYSKAAARDFKEMTRDFKGFAGLMVESDAFFKKKQTLRHCNSNLFRKVLGKI